MLDSLSNKLTISISSRVFSASLGSEASLLFSGQQILFEDFVIQGHTLETISDTKFLICFADSTAQLNSYIPKAAIITRTDDELTAGTPLSLTVASGTEGRFPVNKVISTTRAISVSKDRTNDELNISLLDISGDTPSELDTQTVSVTYDTGWWSIAVLSDTQIAFAYQATGSGDIDARAIDVTSDSITLGAVYHAQTSGTGPGDVEIAKNTDTSFIIAANNRLEVLNVSGTTTSLGGVSSTLTTGTAKVIITRMRADENHVVVHEDGLDWKSRGVTLDGNTITLGTAITLDNVDGIDSPRWNILEAVNPNMAILGVTNDERLGNSVTDAFFQEIFYEDGEVTAKNFTTIDQAVAGEYYYDHSQIARVSNNEVLIHNQFEDLTNNTKEIAAKFFEIVTALPMSGTATIEMDNSGILSGGTEPSITINNLTYNSVSTSNALGGSTRNAFRFSEDGSIVFAHSQNDRIQGRDLTSPYAINTGSGYNSDYDLNASASISSIQGMDFNSDHTELIFPDTVGDDIVNFRGTTADDPSTFSVGASSGNLGSILDTLGCVCIANNDLNIYVGGSDDGTARAELWTRSSASDDMDSLTHATGQGLDIPDLWRLQDMDVVNNGSTLIAAGPNAAITSRIIIEIPLATPFRLDSAVMANKIIKDIGAQITGAVSFDLSRTGFVNILNSANGHIFEYTI